MENPDPDTHSESSRHRGLILGVCTVCLVVLLWNLASGEALEPLLLGWIPFMDHAFQRVNGSGVAWLLTGFAVFLTGAHFAIRWIWDHMVQGRWKDRDCCEWRSGMTVSVILILGSALFVGMSVLGIVHQVGWMARSPEKWRTARERNPLLMIALKLDSKIRDFERETSPQRPGPLTVAELEEVFRQSPDFFGSMGRFTTREIQVVLMANEQAAYAGFVLESRKAGLPLEKGFVFRFPDGHLESLVRRQDLEEASKAFSLSTHPIQPVHPQP